MITDHKITDLHDELLYICLLRRRAIVHAHFVEDEEEGVNLYYRKRL